MAGFGGLNSALRGTVEKRQQRKKLRTLIVESLEVRTLLAADLGWSGFQQFLSNPVQADATNLLQAVGSRVDLSRELEDAFRDGKQSIEATHFYMTDGQPQGMVIYPDRIALGLSSDIVGPFNLQWTEAFGLTETRPLAGPGNFSVYVSAEPITEELISSLTDTGWVEQVVPVFQVVETQSEAVLLNEVIVKLPSGVDPEVYFSDSRFGGYVPLAGTPDQFVATLTAGYGEAALAEINQMSRDPSITWAAPNFHQGWQRHDIPNDPRWANLWHLENTGQTQVGANAVPGLAGTDVNITEAWDIKQGSNSSIVVGVLDDGVPAPFIVGIQDHPDILNYVGDANFGGGVDTNGNGWIGDRHGWDFVNNGFISWPSTSGPYTPTSPNDRHGTAVAGLAAARGDNGIGVVGPAYGSPVIAAKMFANGLVANDAGIASALYYLAGRTLDGLGQWDSATVVNHSWGGGANSAAINDALTWATTEARGGLGVTQFFSSGNSGGLVGYPASQAAVNPGIVVVGAINNAGELTPYHNRGDLLDIVAPSNDFRSGYLRIDSTDRRGAEGYDPSDYTGTGANGFGGTSASAPIAAGVAALALAHAEDLSIDITAAEMRSLIRNNTQLAGGVAYDTANNGRNFSGGFGLIDAGSLLSGIGTAQISVHTSFADIPDSSSGWTFGEVFLGSVNEAVLRIRNQGTETLDISNISVSGGADFIVSQPAQSSLGLGEATTFVITFNPTTAGPQSSQITIASNDASFPSFSFEIEAEVALPDAYGFVFEDRNGDGVRQDGENTLAGRRAFADSNGNGTWDTFNTASFLNNTPEVISPTGTPTVISTVNVSGLTDFVTDVTVRLNITHSWIGDLGIFLEAPTGEFSLLVNQRGGSGDNMVDTVFDDSASQGIGEGSAPFTGTFRPETPLSVFTGLSAADANGDWNLIIFDLFDQDGGSLNEWEVTIGTGEYSAGTDGFGYYAFDGVPAGSFDTRLVDQAGWTAPVAAPGSYPIVLPNPNPGQTYSDLDFGIGRNNRFYAQVFEDLNGDGIADLGEAGRANRTLFIDGNANGVLDGLVDSEWVDAPGTAFGGEVLGTPATITETQEVSGLVGLLQDLEIKLNVSHPWINDNVITLIAPDSTEVLLFNRRGGNGQNMVDTVFDDGAAVSITAAVAANAPFTGSWRPEQPLSTLIGIDPNGTWGLRIDDLFPSLDDGVLNDWTLTITTSPDTPFDTDADGWASFDLDAGTYDILLTDVGFSFTVPADGKREVTASGAPLFNQTYGERDALPPASVVGSFVSHGGYTGLGSPIDTGKSLLKEGASAQALTFDNLINSSRGLNGLVFDIENLAGTLSASDFVFQVSPTGAFDQSLNPPSGWIAAPAPSSISVTPGSPDRVLIEWPDNAIANRWLRIEVLANANTGLPAPEVYYIGHLLGETTGVVSSGVFTVQFFDITLVRNGSGATVDASNILDIDKSGTVSFADIAAMRPNVGTQLTAVTIPGAAPLLLSSPGAGGNRGDSKSDRGSAAFEAAPLVDSNLSQFGSNLGDVRGGTEDLPQLLSVATVGGNSFNPNSKSVDRDSVFGQLDQAVGFDERGSSREDTSGVSIEALDSVFGQFAGKESLEDSLLGTR
jgi:subtilisin-like proprotein convertase family protein